MRILTKKRLCFEFDGQKFFSEPLIIMSAPDWIVKSQMFQLASQEPGLLTVFESKKQIATTEPKKTTKSKAVTKE